MNYFTIAFAVCMSIVLVSGQYFGPQFDSFGSYNGFGLSAISGDFGGPTAFAGSFQARDPRQNRGPVVFPPSPADAPNESSGVIVGASGYGFVPPQNRLQTESTAKLLTDSESATQNYPEKTPISCKPE